MPSVLFYTNAYPGGPFIQHGAGQSNTVISYLYPGAVQPKKKTLSVLSYTNGFPEGIFPQHLFREDATITAPNGSFTDGSGNVWTWGFYNGLGQYEIFKNGSDTGGYGAFLYLLNGIVWTLNSSGSPTYYYWNGSGWVGGGSFASFIPMTSPVQSYLYPGAVQPAIPPVLDSAAALTGAIVPISLF